MGFDFLARTMRVTVLITVLVALAAASYLDVRLGLAVAAGSAWSLANLWLLRALVKTLSPNGKLAHPLRAMLLLGVKGPLLYGAGWALLAAGLPVLGLVVGFGLFFVVVVARALGMWLTHPEWRTRTAAVLVAGALAGSTLLVHSSATAQPSAAPTAGASEQTVHAKDAATEAVAAEHEGKAHAKGEHAEGKHEEGAPELPNIVTYLEAFFQKPDGEIPAWLHWVKEWENVLYAFLAAVVLIFIFGNAAKPRALIPAGMQNFAEWLLGGLNDFFLGILGPEGKPHVPFVGSLFLYIVAMNWMGMIPFLKSPSTSLNTTFALAVCVFVYVQWVGISKNGLGGYLYHFAGQPKDAIGWGSAVLLFPLEVMGEFIKPISLSCRLFGNILGEDILLAVFVGLGVTVLSFAHSPIGIPLQLPFLALSTLMGVIQGLVFSLLATVYIVMMMPHGEHHEDHSGGHAAASH